MTRILTPFYDIKITQHGGKEIGFASYYIKKDSVTLQETTVYTHPDYDMPDTDTVDAEGGCIDALGVHSDSELEFLPNSVDPYSNGVWFSEIALEEYWDEFDATCQSALISIGSGWLDKLPRK